MTISFVLLLAIIVLFAIFGLPRFARAAYLSWFDVEKFRKVEVKRIEKLWEGRPENLPDNTQRWRERVQTQGWLWYNRIIVTVSLIVVIALIIVIGLGFAGIGPAAPLVSLGA
jgi:archaellum biogenesis protein FlaJ (TadC family)